MKDDQLNARLEATKVDCLKQINSTKVDCLKQINKLKDENIAFESTMRTIQLENYNSLTQEREARLAAQAEIATMRSEQEVNRHQFDEAYRQLQQNLFSANTELKTVKADIILHEKLLTEKDKKLEENRVYQLT